MAEELDVEAIVEKAFGYFYKFVDRGNKLESVLLEELEPNEDGWIVAIGFNGKRKESTEPSSAGPRPPFVRYGTSIWTARANSKR